MEFHSKIYADGLGPSYDYTPNGRLSRRTWARGIVTDYAYDAWGNLTNTVYSDDTPAVSLCYDAMGRQTSAITEGVLTNLYFYSAYGELTNEVQNGVSIARSYDTYSRPMGYTLRGSVPPCEINYSYDAVGRFAAVEFDSNAEPQSRRVEYGYLPGTDLVTGYTSGDFSRSVSYEPHRDLIAAVTNSFNSSTPNSSTPPLTIISTFAYENDAAGRRISRIDTFDGGVTTNVFGYNIRSEVTSAAMGTNSYDYAYDPIGNRLSSSHNTETNAYTANALNQYTSISNLCASVPPCEPSYDADGNMAADERGWHYFWNGENRMVCASNAEVVVTYAYDHRGRMVRKEILPTSTNSTFSILHSTFVWDGWNIIRETATGLSTFQPFNLSTSYVWGLDIDGTIQGAGGVGGLLAVIRSNSNSPTPNSPTPNSPTPNSPTPNSSTHKLFLPSYDANGNVTEYVATNGVVVAHYEYSPFGEPVVSSGELASAFTHQFSTKPYCHVTGFNEYVYRKYRPAIGRWMSRDQKGEQDSLAILYCFVANSTLGNVDFIGLWKLPFSTSKKPCCGDKEYDPEKECCLEEDNVEDEMADDPQAINEVTAISEVRFVQKEKYVIYSKEPIATGIKKGHWFGKYNGRNGVVHYWIEWSGGSADANALDDRKVHVPALRAYSPLGDGVTITEIKLSPCVYDISKFKSCVIQEATIRNGKSFGMCNDFVETICSLCESKAKRSDAH